MLKKFISATAIAAVAGDFQKGVAVTSATAIRFNDRINKGTPRDPTLGVQVLLVPYRIPYDVAFSNFSTISCAKAR